MRACMYAARGTVQYGGRRGRELYCTGVGLQGGSSLLEWEMGGFFGLLFGRACWRGTIRTYERSECDEREMLDH